MSNKNQCSFTGRIGNDLELKYSAKGDAVLSISLAISKQYKDSQGKKQEKTTWVRLVAFRHHADFLKNYAKKGSSIRVESEYVERKWQDQNGADRYTSEFYITDVEITSGWSEQQSQQNNQQAGWGQPQQPAQQSNEPPMDFSDDIPFAPIGLPYPRHAIYVI
ncbi:TPA: single-stranded DNA-binding protein [Providencia rettgeri]|nr:single-stranded DNA-binding protein [Providencia rettgeri]